MSTGNKAIPDLPPIPDPTGGSLYITKANTDYKVDTGGAGGLATLGPDGLLDPTQRFTISSFPFSSISGKPTTLAGYGITDAVPLSSFTFASLGGKPTTISGYGITDAVTLSGSQTISGTKTFSNTISGNISGNASTATAANSANTATFATSAGSATTANSANAVPWSGVSSKPTTLAGFGITDGMQQLGTGGISFGSNAATGVVLNKHIDMYGGTFGFNITTNAQNYIVPTGGVHNFLVAGTTKAQVNASGLVVTGAITATANVTAYSSDARLKINVKNIEKPMDKLYMIGGYTFDWDVNKCFVEGFRPDNTHEHGVLAQEVQKIMPDAVTPAPFNPKYLTVNYARLVPLLIECIKDLQSQIDELKGI